MANETTKLTAMRGLNYGNVQVKRGAEFEARSLDVEGLTSGDRPLAVGGKSKTAAKAETAKAEKSDAEATPADAPKDEAPKKESGSLPEDFPARDMLVEAGVKTLAAVRKLDKAALVDLPGIGEATAKKILKAAK